jgi:taurine dioxygenase
MEIQPSGHALGARITDLDLATPFSKATAAAIRDALWSHCVLHFPAQNLSERQQLEFTEIFGKPQIHVRPQPGVHEPGIFVVSNVLENGVPIGALGHGHIGFHCDLAYLPEPGTISALYAQEVPEGEGATTWAGGYAAYEALDAQTRQMLEGIYATHRHTTPELNPTQSTAHPVVCTHPQTRRKTLFVTPLFTQTLVGLPESVDGAALLKRLTTHATDSRFTWTHQWQPGDLIVWDNRVTSHSRAAFDPSKRRVMRRTQIFNDKRPQP